MPIRVRTRRASDSSWISGLSLSHRPFEPYLEQRQKHPICMRELELRAAGVAPGDGAFHNAVSFFFILQSISTSISKPFVSSSPRMSRIASLLNTFAPHCVSLKESPKRVLTSKLKPLLASLRLSGCCIVICEVGSLRDAITPSNISSCSNIFLRSLGRRIHQHLQTRFSCLELP